jgi:hypothetical protein
MTKEDLEKLENYNIEDETLKRLVYKAVRDLKNQNTNVEITGETSDGYHTFNELYEHRTILFACLCNMVKDYKSVCYKAKKHADGTGYEDMFLACIKTPEGDYSYHCDMKYWDLFKIEAREFADPWDGHQPKDIMRLFSILPEN